MPAEDFEGYVATDGSLLGKVGKWEVCGWAVVQLDYDEEMVLLHGMYGSMEAELEIQRTIKRAELTAFVCFLKRVMDLSRCTLITQELLMGYGEERESIKPRA